MRYTQLAWHMKSNEGGLRLVRVRHIVYTRSDPQASPAYT